jgi:3,4-dihydroxy 2-butanone 4-phosphate synthase/GTP cyclohydrolase II
MELIERILPEIGGRRKPDNRPFVTLSYAQTLDGSIAARPGEQFFISGDSAAHFTHQLRAHHDGILVGIGTVIADDPQLTVRLVEGENPQPVVLDSQLRMPPGAFLLNTRKAWIATTDRADSVRVAEFEAKGIHMLHLPADSFGQVSLPDLMDDLDHAGIDTLMVEGGAQVITSFLIHRLVDLLILTISPRFLGGLRAFDTTSFNTNGSAVRDSIRIEDLSSAELGGDLIIWGRPIWLEENGIVG